MSAADELSMLCVKLVKAADEAEAGKEGREERALDIIKRLDAFPITMDLLINTEAAKVLKRIVKHPIAKLGSATSALIKAWKEKVTRESATKERESPAAKPNVAVPEAREEAAGAAQEPPTPSAKPNTGDPARDKLAVSLGDALAKVLEESEDKDGLADPAMVGISIENAMTKKFGTMTKEYKAKYRSISFNLKDTRNPDLRRKVLAGEISPYMLLTLSAEELASNEARNKNEEIRKYKSWECERGMTSAASTDQFKCGKCGQRKCTYYQMQTRSADEPMTTFVSCINCSNRWKFC